MARNRNLNSAGIAKADEFYTQLPVIEAELRHYRDHFRGKVILCNCDDPYESHFFRFFALNFNHLGLRRLIATCYFGSPIANTQISLFDHESVEDKTTRAPHRLDIVEVDDYNGDGAFDLADVEYLLRNRRNALQRLEGNGDFRSEECVELLRQADIVVTNPPFSLFREYVAKLMEHEKQFIIIGNVNAITYREKFPLIKANRLWLGVSIHSGDREFPVPDSYPLEAAGFRVDENGVKYIRVKGVRWFTNLDYKERHCNLTLFKRYSPTEYTRYDNYDAINVDKVADIPMDWPGVMGVPITFLDRYNPEQFAIVGLIAGNIRGLAGIESKTGKDGPYIDGKLRYGRILVRRIGAAQ